MTLLDRFRTQPPQKHADPGVRLAYVQEIPMDERDLLTEIARGDADARVRRAAVAKLIDPAALAEVAAADADHGVRDEALAMLRDIALDAFEGLEPPASLAAVDALSDQRMLATVAKTALREDVALRALSRVVEPHALGSIARHAEVEPVRLGALAALQDHDEIFNVALNGDFKDSAVAAVERLDDRTELERVVSHGNNKGAVKRARAILREMEERGAAEAAEQTRLAQMAQAEAEERERARRLAEETDRARAEDAARQEAARLAENAARARAAEEAARQRQEEEQQEQQRLEQQAADGRRRAEELLEHERQLAAQAAAEERDRRARKEALSRLQQLAVRVESLSTRADLTLKAGERALRDLRAALADVPPLASPATREEIVQRLKNGQTALTTRVQELRELTDWQRWANLGLQEQLCAQMEALSSLETPAEIVRRVRALQQQWRAASDVPRPQGDALWRRFKAAHDVVWARCEAHFAEEAAARAENEARKVALCERAEALAGSTRWIETAEALKRMQAEWKTIGPVSRGQEKAVWDRFRGACDRFFTRRQADLAEHKKRWAANLERKVALCEQVETLAESSEWDAAASEIKRLQAEWKTIGPVKKSRSEAIWQRFRTACDRFFARYAQRHEIAVGERVAAREAICAELESLASSAAPGSDGPSALSPQEMLAAVRALRGRWQQEIAARAISRERAAELDQRFAAAFARAVAAAPTAFAGTDLDPDANRTRMETLVRRMEELAASLGAPAAGAAADAALSPTTRAAAMLKEALAANTIGGKVDQDHRFRAAADEVRQAQASWARIGPVRDDLRRALADRFERACRRILERVAPPRGDGKGQRPSRP